MKQRPRCTIPVCVVILIIKELTNSRSGNRNRVVEYLNSAGIIHETEFHKAQESIFHSRSTIYAYIHLVHRWSAIKAVLVFILCKNRHRTSQVRTVTTNNICGSLIKSRLSVNIKSLCKPHVEEGQQTQLALCWAPAVLLKLSSGL